MYEFTISQGEGDSKVTIATAITQEDPRNVSIAVYEAIQELKKAIAKGSK